MPPAADAKRAQVARDKLAYYAAVERALTREVLRRTRIYARERCSVLERAGLIRDADELVNDAVADTLEQRRTWKADDVPLRVHLKMVIKSTTSTLVRDRGGRSVPFDHRPGVADRQKHVPRTAEADGIEVVTARQSAASHFVQCLYEVAEAKSDRQVVGILDAYSQGITKRAEVAQQLGIRVKQYDHARQRLSRMVKQLPAGVATDAQEVMRQWS